jgi:D-glycero-D-manno-heptose 1,7-bisphosphate phosphatase
MSPAGAVSGPAGAVGGVAGLLVDRDGVLNRRVEGSYVLEPSQLELLEGIIPLLARATALDVPVAIVTNQGCVSQGRLSPAGLEAIHHDLLGHLASKGVRVAGVYVCPHHPSALVAADRRCGCRKPEPGLLLSAARELGLDLARSVMIGDQDSDRAAAEAAGIPPGRVWVVDPSGMSGEEAGRLASAVIEALVPPLPARSARDSSKDAICE